MENLKMLIVDDEANNRQILSTMIRQTGHGFSAIFQAKDIPDAMEVINRESPEIVFLDINLQNESGFDLLQQLPDRSFEVIFVTAHESFALKAFRFNAADYLLKPILASELQQAIGKAVQKIGLNPMSGPSLPAHIEKPAEKRNAPASISIATANGFTVVPVSQIVYAKASSNYSTIITSDGQKIIASQTLGYFEELLEGGRFFRTHRSYLINLDFVKSYKKGDSGFIVMSNNDEVELSRQNRAAFLELFKH
jgi:two-component system LytT family response regulator